MDERAKETRIRGPYRGDVRGPTEGPPSELIIVRVSPQEFLVEVRSPVWWGRATVEALLPAAWCLYWAEQVGTHQALSIALILAGFAALVWRLRRSTIETVLRLSPTGAEIRNSAFLQTNRRHAPLASLGSPEVFEREDGDGELMHFLQFEGGDVGRLFDGHAKEHLIWLKAQINRWLREHRGAG